MKKKNDTSPRSRGAGQQAQDEFTKRLTTLVKKIEGNLNNVDIMECDKVPKVVLDFEKKDKTKLN